MAKTNPELVDELIERSKADPNYSGGRVTQEHLDKSLHFALITAVFDPRRIWTQFRLLLPIGYRVFVPEWDKLPEPFRRAFAEVIADLERWVWQFTRDIQSK